MFLVRVFPYFGVTGILVPPLPEPGIIIQDLLLWRVMFARGECLERRSILFCHGYQTFLIRRPLRNRSGEYVFFTSGCPGQYPFLVSEYDRDEKIGGDTPP